MMTLAGSSWAFFTSSIEHSEFDFLKNMELGFVRISSKVNARCVPQVAQPPPLLCEETDNMLESKNPFYLMKPSPTPAHSGFIIGDIPSEIVCLERC